MTEDLINEDIKPIAFSTKGVPIMPKTEGQKKYVKAISDNDICFGIGPAGTGKTYLASAMAVSTYKKKKIDRIIITRPAVEAGESLGFLPGDLEEKIDPYLRPLYDSLHDLLGADSLAKMRERGFIEIVPLAYMRGRTLDDSFIILDEAQNTTREQMKMMLTRLGKRSKIVINGDITQIDLPRGRASGLIDAEKILKGIEGIEFVYLNSSDVLRHKLVKKIIEAYGNFEYADKQGIQNFKENDDERI